MRASNWSATAAISAPSPLRQQYGDVLGSAGSLLRQAADGEDHHGAHYSLALLYKLYPGLVASSVKVEDAAKAGAARACAAERATIRWLKQGSAGRYGVAAALGGIAADRIVVLGIRSGSVIVDFAVLAAADGTLLEESTVAGVFASVVLPNCRK